MAVMLGEGLQGVMSPRSPSLLSLKEMKGCVNISNIRHSKAFLKSIRGKKSPDALGDFKFLRYHMKENMIYKTTKYLHLTHLDYFNT